MVSARAAHIGGMNALFAETPLKVMDPSALAQATMHQAAAAGMDLVVIADAIDVATYLHLGQTRANRGPFTRTPYIEHPLRNALRALRKGVTAQHVVIGILLHDVVEDCLPRLLAAFVPGDHAGIDVTAQRNLAYSWIASRFGAGASRIVDMLTNPPGDGAHLSRDERNAGYNLHVEVGIFQDAEIFIGKFVDFEDNAGGLHHNAVPGNEKMVGQLANKYLPTADIFIVELERNGAAIRALVSEAGYTEIAAKLPMIKSRLARLVAEYA
jgi:hypothetical protein